MRPLSGTLIYHLYSILIELTSESIYTNYWLNAYSSFPRKRAVRSADRPDMTITVYRT